MEDGTPKVLRMCLDEIRIARENALEMLWFSSAMVYRVSFLQTTLWSWNTLTKVVAKCSTYNVSLRCTRIFHSHLSKSIAQLSKVTSVSLKTSQPPPYYPNPLTHPLWPPFLCLQHKNVKPTWNWSFTSSSVPSMKTFTCDLSISSPPQYSWCRSRSLFPEPTDIQGASAPRPDLADCHSPRWRPVRPEIHMCRLSVSKNCVFGPWWKKEDQTNLCILIASVGEWREGPSPGSLGSWSWPFHSQVQKNTSSQHFAPEYCYEMPSSSYCVM